MHASDSRPVGKAVVYGVISFLLYALLYVFEDHILRWTVRGRWFFVFPVLVAFVFSLFHGAFTGYFWDALGVRARTSKVNQKVK